MTVTITLSAQVHAELAARAAQRGETLEAYLVRLAQSDGVGENPAASLPGGLSDEHFEKFLDELAAGPTGVHLPPDFSRSDIYADHS